MIRIRRRQGTRWPRVYEIEEGLALEPVVHRLRRGAAVRLLEQELDRGDAWTCVEAADRAWSRNSHGWAVEYDGGGVLMQRHLSIAARE